MSDTTATGQRALVMTRAGRTQGLVVCQGCGRIGGTLRSAANRRLYHAACLPPEDALRVAMERGTQRI